MCGRRECLGVRCLTGMFSFYLRCIFVSQIGRRKKVPMRRLEDRKQEGICRKLAHMKGTKVYIEMLKSSYGCWALIGV